MEKLIIYILIVLLALFSCEICKTASNKDLFVLKDSFEVQVGKKMNSSIDSTIYKSIYAYVKKFTSELHDEYYNVYFFKNNSADYFTIWSDQFPPKMIEKYNPNALFNYYWFQIDKDDVIFIVRDDDKSLMPFKPFRNQLDKINLEDLPAKRERAVEIFAYRTYKYYYQNDKYHVERLKDTIYMDFMGEEGIMNEMRILRKENEMIKHK